MLHSQITRMKIAPLKGFCRCLWIFQIALHHRIAADHDFTLSFAIHWHLRHLFIHNGDMFHHRKGHALAGLDGGAHVFIGIAPSGVIPNAFCYVSIGFG